MFEPNIIRLNQKWGNKEYLEYLYFKTKDYINKNKLIQVFIRRNRKIEKLKFHILRNLIY